MKSLSEEIESISKQKKNIKQNLMEILEVKNEITSSVDGLYSKRRRQNKE